MATTPVVSAYNPHLTNFRKILVNHSAALVSAAEKHFHIHGVIADTGFDTSTDSYTTGETYNDFWNENGSTKASPLEHWWNVFDLKYLRHSLTWTITLLILYTVILIVGVIGNFLVILVVALRPKMRTASNLFIMNLAVADLLVVVFCVPPTFMANAFTTWILGPFMCKGVAYVQGVSVFASSHCLAAISFDRCKAICRPLEKPRGFSKTQAFSTVCLIWILAFLVTLPRGVTFNAVTSPQNGLSYCVEIWKNEHHEKIYFFLFNIVCCYCLPLVLISLSNVVIWWHVSHRSLPQEFAMAGIIQAMHRETRQGVRKMLGIVTLTFLLCWLPLYVLVARLKFFGNIGYTESTLIFDILMPCAQWLGSMNSSINPLLYGFLNKKFRDMVKSLLPSWTPFLQGDNTTLLQNPGSRGTFTKLMTSIIDRSSKTRTHTNVIINCPACNSNVSRQFSRRHFQRHCFYSPNPVWNIQRLQDTDFNIVPSTVVVFPRTIRNTPFSTLSGVGVNTSWWDIIKPRTSLVTINSNDCITTSLITVPLLPIYKL